MIGAAGTALNETERKMRFAKGARERERERELSFTLPGWLAGCLFVCPAVGSLPAR